MNMNKMMFPGKIMGIDRKTDDTNQEAEVLLELTDANGDGEVEIAFEDRNERFYVRFFLPELVARALLHGRDTE